MDAISTEQRVQEAFEAGLKHGKILTNAKILAWSSEQSHKAEFYMGSHTYVVELDDLNDYLKEDNNG